MGKSRWLERLLDKKTRLTTHQNRAVRWSTCAVGEAHKDFPAAVIYEPGFFYTAPVDPELRKLGQDFYRAVKVNERRRALRIYDAIQARVRVLLRKAS